MIKKCNLCNKIFHTYKKNSKCCSKKCADIFKTGKRNKKFGTKYSEEMKINMRRSRVYINCLYCSKEFWNIKANIERGKAKFCSKKCHYSYAKTITRQHKGYNLIHIPDHPFSNPHGRIKEHRVIIEKIIGRYLNRDEEVHHVDRNRLNNNIKNLMCFINKSAHARFHHNPLNVKQEEIIFDGRNHNPTP